MTSTLRENLFILFVSLLSNVSSILVGPPGSSKTLCTRILYQAMRGPESKVEFFQQFPTLIYKTYQCSVLSTSTSIERAFKQAKQNQSKFKDSHIVGLILDEIGLAEASIQNPLKVLHKLLEDKSNVTMIALSNWQLDASKMNRANFTNRPKLSQAELQEAAVQIRNRVMSKEN